MSQILKQAQKLVIPTEKIQKEKDAIVEQVIKLVQSQVSSYPHIVSVEIVGSYAKGTWLPQKADIDVFVKFQNTTPEKEFVEIGKKIGFSTLKEFKPYVRYAEHPFVEAQIKDTKVNVVPCYDVTLGNWKSSADRSPFHTKFMINALSEQAKGEVRLLKAFLKANNIYGAEIAMGGFSGYVAEVLVLNFGSFDNVIKAVSELKQNQTIGKTEKTFESTIIIIDPIDPNRNLGAAISTENVGRFVLAARAYLEKPTLAFFTKNRSQKTHRSSLENVVVLSFQFKQRSPDIIWGQLKRAATSIATQIDQVGFTVLRRSVAISENTAALLFLLHTKKLEKNHVRAGPDFFVAEHLNKFVAANKKKNLLMWINDEGKICSLQKRKQIDVEMFLKDLIKNNLDKAGIPAGLKSDIKSFKIIRAGKASKSIKEAAVKLVSTDETIFSS